MTNIDPDDWHTGEFERPIKPIAPSSRGRPPAPVTSDTTTHDGAGDQGQGDEKLPQRHGR